MLNMLSVIQNHKTNLLKDTSTPMVQEFTMYNAQVDWLDINQIKNHYGTCKKNFKERSIQLLLEIKVKKKYRILKVYLGVEK